MKGSCTDCDVGFYKDVVGDGACTKCINGKSTSRAGATKASDCGKASIIMIPANR